MFKIALALAAGAAVAIQTLLNGHVRSLIGGPLWAAALNNFVGLLGLGLALLVVGARAPGLDAARDMPLGYLTAGLLGATFVATNAWLAPQLGQATTFVLVLSGQLAASLLIDRVGWSTGTAAPLTAPVLAGVLLVVIGAALVVRHR